MRRLSDRRSNTFNKILNSLAALFGTRAHICSLDGSFTRLWLLPWQKLLADVSMETVKHKLVVGMFGIAKETESVVVPWSKGTVWQQ